MFLSYVVRQALKRGPLERPRSNEDTSAAGVGNLTVKLKRNDLNDVSETLIGGSQVRYLDTVKVNRKVFVEGAITYRLNSYLFHSPLFLPSELHRIAPYAPPLDSSRTQSTITIGKGRHHITKVRRTRMRDMKGKENFCRMGGILQVAN